MSFEEATNFVRNGPKVLGGSNEEKLTFYKYFKQATEGDVKGDEPWLIQFEAKAKYDAWASVKGMVAEDAKQKYVEFLTENVPSWTDWKQ